MKSNTTLLKQTNKTDYIDMITDKLAISGKVKVSKYKSYTLYTSKEGISFLANSELMFRTKLLKFYNIYNNVTYLTFKLRINKPLFEHVIAYYPIKSIKDYNKFNSYTLKELKTLRNAYLVNTLAPHLITINPKDYKGVYWTWGSENSQDVCRHIRNSLTQQWIKQIMPKETKGVYTIPFPILQNKLVNKTLYSFFKKKLNYIRDFKAHQLDKIEIKSSNRPKRSYKPGRNLIYKINYTYPEFIIINDRKGELLDKAVYINVIKKCIENEGYYGCFRGEKSIFIQGYYYRFFDFYYKENDTILPIDEFLSTLMLLYKKPLNIFFIGNRGYFCSAVLYDEYWAQRYIKDKNKPVRQGKGNYTSIIEPEDKVRFSNKANEVIKDDSKTLKERLPPIYDDNGNEIEY